MISLGDIAIYTDETEVPLSKVLTSIKEKENGVKASISTSAKPEELRAYFAEILPDYDRERVYPTDIKKIISWYNLLIGAGLTDFETEEAAGETEAEDAEETKEAGKE